MNFIKSSLAIAALSAMSLSHAAPVVVGNTNAVQLANAIAGSGITVTNAVFSTDSTGQSGAVAGTFSNGTGSVGFDKGIVLTTGTAACAGAKTTTTNCTSGAPAQSASYSSLKFDFTSASGNVFFQYVFGSNEYNQYVNSTYNDTFELLLNGVNIALLPGGGGPVSINNVNCTKNSAYYRNNEASFTGCAYANLDVQYTGLTVVLTATAALKSGTNTFEFKVSDVSDKAWDSGVYIRAGSFSATNPGTLPEPASLALAGVALLGGAAARRRRQNA